MDLLEHDCEDGMRARRSVVHFCRGCCAAVVAHPHVAKEFCVVLDGEVGQVFDVGALCG